MLLTKFVWEVQLAKSVSFQVCGLYYLFDPLLHLGNLAMMWTWILAGNLFSCLSNTRFMTLLSAKGKTDLTNSYCHSPEHTTSTF